MGYKRLKSPKDLIKITTWVPTPEDAKEALANAGSLKHREITAEEAIRLEMAYLKKTSTAALRRVGKDPSRYQDIIDRTEFADRAYCAALVLKTLDGVEEQLINIEDSNSCGDSTSMYESALSALYLALECAYHLELLTVADHEREIVTGKRTAQNLRASSSKANAARRTERSAQWARWNIDAAQIWQRHPELTQQAVARQLKRKLELGDDVRTIAKRLKKPGMAG
jgi:hypothetical protein